ncbi:MAG: NAD(+) kinase, partial [Candidatus Kerfeldbacteria bacterium CG08_land_8_20_14_0_20_42_7]
ISTPTGSTGYSLSANGPLVFPDLSVVLITPISAHTLSSRPLVLPSTTRIEVSLTDDRRGKGTISLDGQEQLPLFPGDLL